MLDCSLRHFRSWHIPSLYYRVAWPAAVSASAVPSQQIGCVWIYITLLVILQARMPPAAKPYAVPSVEQLVRCCSSNLNRHPLSQHCWAHVCIPGLMETRSTEVLGDPGSMRALHPYTIQLTPMFTAELRDIHLDVWIGGSSAYFRL